MKVSQLMGRCDGGETDSCTTRSSSSLSESSSSTSLRDLQDQQQLQQQEQKENVLSVKVAIIGAGAAGLQCAHSLIAEYGLSSDQLVILEARDRIGGRIHTAPLTRTAVGSTETSVTFAHDYGAAWLHGTGYPKWGKEDTMAYPMCNPMMKLLQEATPTGQNVYDCHLEDTFAGNPWTRPKTVLHNENKIAMYSNGQELSAESAITTKALERYFMILQEVSSLGNETLTTTNESSCHKETLSLKHAVDAVLQQNQRLRSQLELINDEQERELVSRLTEFYFHLVECWNGTSISNLKWMEFVDKLDDGEKEASSDETVTDDAEYELEGDFTGSHCKMKNGMLSVLEPLLREGVSDRIRLSHPVVRIRNTNSEQRGGGGKLIIESAVSDTVVHADVCILTIPIGCLQNIASKNPDFFEPHLSASKLEAFSSYNVGSYKKVLLTFDRIFWPAEKSFIGLSLGSSNNDDDDANNEANRPLGNSLLFNNLLARKGLPCLEAVLFGDAGSWACHKSEEEIAAAVLDFMIEAMSLTNDTRTYLKHCEVTRWEEDPYCLGAYSSVALEAPTWHTEALKQPEWEGRLLFAGEATVAEFEGSVHAALLSGMEGAKQAHSVLIGEKSETIEAAPPVISAVLGTVPSSAFGAVAF